MESEPTAFLGAYRIVTSLGPILAAWINWFFTNKSPNLESAKVFPFIITLLFVHFALSFAFGVATLVDYDYSFQLGGTFIVWSVYFAVFLGILFVYWLDNSNNSDAKNLAVLRMFPWILFGQEAFLFFYHFIHLSKPEDAADIYFDPINGTNRVRIPNQAKIVTEINLVYAGLQAFSLLAILFAWYYFNHQHPCVFLGNLALFNYWAFGTVQGAMLIMIHYLGFGTSRENYSERTAHTIQLTILAAVVLIVDMVLGAQYLLKPKYPIYAIPGITPIPKKRDEK